MQPAFLAGTFYQSPKTHDMPEYHLDLHLFHRIALKQNNLGHFEVPVRINGMEALFLVDTGAANTVIDLAYAKEMNIPLTESLLKGGGVGNADMELFEVGCDSFACEEMLLPGITLYAIDFSHIRQSLLLRGETSFPAGVLGADVFFAYKAIIDYGNEALYLLKENLPEAPGTNP